MVKRIFANILYIFKTSCRWTAVIYAFLGFVCTFAPLNECLDESISLWKRIILSLLILATVWFIISIITAVITCLKNSYKVYEVNNHKVFVHYGDLFSSDFITDTVRRRNIVIPVNRCFDTLVDDDLVSSNTLHGVLVNKLISNGKTREQIDALIDSSLASQNYQYITLSSKDKRKGKIRRYPVGSVAEVKETDKCTYFLLGLSCFDENLVATVSDEEYVLAISRIFEFCNKRSQQYPVVMPLIGGGLSRTGKSEREILEYLIKLIKLNKSQLLFDLHIVVRDSGKETVPITDL